MNLSFFREVVPSGGTNGADRILGGPGGDILSHSSGTTGTQADGHRDFIDCGPDFDRAFINVSLDSDIAINSETLDVGYIR